MKLLWQIILFFIIFLILEKIGTQKKTAIL
jgi:hypothetical protein